MKKLFGTGVFMKFDTCKTQKGTYLTNGQNNKQP